MYRKYRELNRIVASELEKRARQELEQSRLCIASLYPELDGVTEAILKLQELEGIEHKSLFPFDYMEHRHEDKEFTTFSTGVFTSFMVRLYRTQAAMQFMPLAHRANSQALSMPGTMQTECRGKKAKSGHMKWISQLPGRRFQWQKVGGVHGLRCAVSAMFSSGARTVPTAIERWLATGSRLLVS